LGFHFPATGIHADEQATLLAIDDVSLPLKRNVCYYLSKPQVRKEPVLGPSRDNPQAPDYLAAHFYGTVLHDDGRFRMWYYPVSYGKPNSSAVRAGYGSAVSPTKAYHPIEAQSPPTLSSVRRCRPGGMGSS
jgi:hypothetical protein